MKKESQTNQGFELVGLKNQGNETGPNQTATVN